MSHGCHVSLYDFTHMGATYHFIMGATYTLPHLLKRCLVRIRIMGATYTLPHLFMGATFRIVAFMGATFTIAPLLPCMGATFIVADAVQLGSEIPRI